MTVSDKTIDEFYKRCGIERPARKKTGYEILIAGLSFLIAIAAFLLVIPAILLVAWNCGVAELWPVPELNFRHAFAATFFIATIAKICKKA